MDLRVERMASRRAGLTGRMRLHAEILMYASVDANGGPLLRNNIECVGSVSAEFSDLGLVWLLLRTLGTQPDSQHNEYE